MVFCPGSFEAHLHENEQCVFHDYSHFGKCLGEHSTLGDSSSPFSLILILLVYPSLIITLNSSVFSLITIYNVTWVLLNNLWFVCYACLHFILPSLVRFTYQIHQFVYLTLRVQKHVTFSEQVNIGHTKIVFMSVNLLQKPDWRMQQSPAFWKQKSR